MEPYWFVPDTSQAQVTLESGAGEVWKYIAVTVIPALVLWILNDIREDKKEAKEREAKLNDLLEKHINKQKGETR